MVKFDPKIHHRRSIRLKEYDYAQAGAYFITVVAWQREYLFGEIVQKEMKLNAYGKIVWKCWQQIPVHFPNIETGAFIVMPNHVHGIVFIFERRDHGVVPRSGIPVPEENNPLNITKHNTIMPEGKGGKISGGLTSGGMPQNHERALVTPPLQQQTPP